MDFEPDGTLDLKRVAEAVKPDDFHFARTRLFCLENTQNGQALPLDYLTRARTFAQGHGLKLHLDGARIFNASVKQRVPVVDIAGLFDSVSVCLSKGLGAPVGSLLCSSRQIIKEARRWRKVLGGGMRQAGILAAAGIFALRHHVQRLEEDHLHASLLAEGLRGIEELSVDYSPGQTNMVFLDLPETRCTGIQEYLRQKGIWITGGRRIRLVTHLDTDRHDICRAVEAFKDFFRT